MIIFLSVGCNMKHCASDKQISKTKPALFCKPSAGGVDVARCRIRATTAAPTPQQRWSLVSQAIIKTTTKHPTLCELVDLVCLPHFGIIIGSIAGRFDSSQTTSLTGFFCAKCCASIFSMIHFCIYVNVYFFIYSITGGKRQPCDNPHIEKQP